MLKMFKRFRFMASAIAGALVMSAASPAVALSTDGYHTIQIIPIAASTGSFTTSFFFHNPNPITININVSYYPAVGTPTAAPIFCGSKAVLANQVLRFTSLAAICPGITAGSNFGWLYTYEGNATNEPYAVFTRVDNPQGQGFEIEGFPPHTFTAATMHVTGLKRQAAAPGFGTNCFVAAFLEPTVLDIALRDSLGNQLGTTQTYALAANEMRRLTDIFAVVGAPAGDYANFRLTATEFATTTEPGAIVFCTVQNNTTFDADFRIAKAFPVQDGHTNRDFTQSTDHNGNKFTIGTYFSADRNQHIVQFKHPDWVQCAVARTDAGALADLEMRLLAPDGTTVVAGGSDVQSFGEVFLGNKSTRNGGSNGNWILEVEAAAAAGQGATYSIRCQSGSGHGGGYFWVGRNLPDAF
jgi:hypothetical protein